MTSVIVGSDDDTHVHAVIAALLARGESAPVLFDAPSLRDDGYTLTLDRLDHHDVVLGLTDATRGWLRRYAPTEWGAGLVAGSEEALSRRSFLSLVGSLARISACEWLTPLDRLLAAEDKLLQLRVATGLGLAVPETIVTSDPAAAADALGDEFVVKPLAGGYFVSPEGPQAVYASVLRRAEALELDFAAAPFLAQRKLEVDVHLRIVTVGKRAWVCDLDASNLPVDWRRDQKAHFSWKVADDKVVADSALAMSNALVVGYSSQDWVRRGNDLHFLDLNPGGQWLFLPDEVASSVTGAIATYLAGSR